MSEKVSSHKIDRTCDGCGKHVEFEMVNTPEDMVSEMLQWFVVGRHVIDPRTDQLVPIMVQACSLPCITPAALKVAQIPANPPDDIDLAALQQAQADGDVTN